MGKKGDILGIGALLIGGVAAVFFLGESVKKGISQGAGEFAKNIQLPNFSPSITLPNINVTMPNINLGITNQGEKIADAAGRGVASVLPGGLALYDYLSRSGQSAANGGGSTGPTQSPENTSLWSGNTNAARKADIEKNGIGPLFAASPTVPTSNLSASSGGGGGIWVPDPKVQGGGYYVQDNSLYGGSSGMPTPSVPTATPSNFEGKSYSAAGYSGTVGGYRNYLNSQMPGAGDSWLTKAKLNPAGYGLI